MKNRDQHILDTRIEKLFNDYCKDDTQNVFTPPSLCREMVSQITLKGDEKVLVLYNVEFAVILNKEFGIPTSSIYVYTNSTTKKYALEKLQYNVIYFNDVLGLSSVDMKFDVVVGNPPYNEGRVGANKSIYDKFINFSLEISNKYILLVTPGGWMDSNKKKYGNLRYTLKSQGIKLIKSASQYFPNQTIQECIYYLVDKNYKDDIYIFETKIPRTLDTEEIKIKGPKDFLYDKLNTKNFPAIRGGVTLYKSHKDKYKTIPQGQFIYPFICNNPKSGVEIIYVEGKNHKQYVNNGKGIVIFNERWDKKNLKLTNIRYIENASQYSFNCNIIGVEVSDESEATRVIEYLNSKLFRFLLGSIQSSGQALILGKLRKLPHWDDNFNLTQDEIDLIESTIK